MNVNTITIDRDEALQKLASYRGLNARQKTNEDERLESLYKAVSNGARVLNVLEAFRATGLNELGEPKLAIAQADWRIVHFRSWHAGDGHFTWKSPRARGKAGKSIGLPHDTFDRGKLTRSGLSSAVPHIPPGVRPKISLANFHILFEVEKWNRYPVDPFLLRHISGYLYVVIAEWELTELEASLLGSMRSGN